MKAWLQRNYFSAVGWMVLGLSVWGFSDNLFWNVGQPSNRDPKFILHGIFCLAWMGAFCLQANLIRSKNQALHRRVGWFSLWAAVGVTLSTLYVFVAVWRGWSAMAHYVQANRLLLVGFAVLVTLGYRNRRRAGHHKRYLLGATLYMLEPVLSRAFDPVEPLLSGYTDAQIDSAWEAFFVNTWLGLFLSLFVFDWVTERRVHPATVQVFGAFCLIWVFVLLV